MLAYPIYSLAPLFWPWSARVAVFSLCHAAAAETSQSSHAHHSSCSKRISPARGKVQNKIGKQYECRLSIISQYLCGFKTLLHFDQTNLTAIPRNHLSSANCHNLTTQEELICLYLLLWAEQFSWTSSDASHDPPCHLWNTPGQDCHVFCCSADGPLVLLLP